MPKYLFNFDIHNADRNVYREIEQRLETSGCHVLEHPLGSTYFIRAGEENVKDLCEKLGDAFCDLSMAFILSRLDRNRYCRSKTVMKELVERVVEEVTKRLKRKSLID